MTRALSASKNCTIYKWDYIRILESDSTGVAASSGWEADSDSKYEDNNMNAFGKIYSGFNFHLISGTIYPDFPLDQ